MGKVIIRHLMTEENNLNLCQLLDAHVEMLILPRNQESGLAVLQEMRST